MPRTCSVCAHPQRVSLEAAVLAGTSIRAAAKTAEGVSPFALRRHLQHVASVVAQRVDAKEVQERAGSSLKGRVEQIIADMRRIAMASEKAGNFTAALAGLRSQLQCLELLGKLTGELRGAGAGEFVPGTTAAAGASASATVSVTLPAAPARDPQNLVRLLKQIYNLTDTPSRIM
jgi:hypothetical protein